MGKLVITADHVRQAKAGGHKAIAVPANAMITPQARDDAARNGIEFVPEGQVPAAPRQQSAPAPAAEKPTTGFEVANKAPGATGFDYADTEAGQTGFGFANAVAAASSFALPQVILPAQPKGAARPASRPAAPVTDVPVTDAFAEVRRRVMEKIPAGTPQAQVDEMIRRAMSTSGCSDCGGGCASCPRTAPANPPIPASGDGAWLTRAGGCVRVDSRALPFGRNAGGVGLMQVLAPAAGGTSPSAGYAQFENGSMNWTFERDEVLVVLEGELTVTADGSSFTANAGDVCAFTGGSSVTFAARGAVRFVSVAPTTKA